MSNTPPHHGVAGGLKFNLMFSKQIHFCVSSNVTLITLLLTIDDSAPLHLKNLNTPLIQASKDRQGNTLLIFRGPTNTSSKTVMLCKSYYLHICYKNVSRFTGINLKGGLK